MREPEKLRLHPTKAGGVSGPILGKFSSKDVFRLGLSLLVGLMVFILAGSFPVNLFLASALPLGTLGVLYALAGQPEGYALHWLEWQRSKRRGLGLFDRHSRRNQQQ